MTLFNGEKSFLPSKFFFRKSREKVFFPPNNLQVNLSELYEILPSAKTLLLK